MLAFTLNSTILNPQFAVNEVEKLDIAAAAHEILEEQLPPDNIYFSAIDKTLDDVEPWMRQQLNEAIFTGYDYLLGRNSLFYLTISTDTLRQHLTENIKQAYIQSAPPEYTQLPAAEKEILLDEIEQQIETMVPPVLEIDQAMIGEDGIQIMTMLRDIFGFIHTGYFILIAVSLVLILLIILILHMVKDATRSLGIIFLIDGALSLIAFLIVKQFAPGLIPLSDLPLRIQSWIPQVINDVLTPWGVFSIILLSAGIVLVVFSFFYFRMRGTSAYVPAQDGNA